MTSSGCYTYDYYRNVIWGIDLGPHAVPPVATCRRNEGHLPNIASERNADDITTTIIQSHLTNNAKKKLSTIPLANLTLGENLHGEYA